MAFIHEIQVKTTGFPGGPGYTNLYFQTTVGADRDPQFAAVKGFIDALALQEPAQWSAQIVNVGRVLEETTGTLALFSVAPAGAVAPVAGNRGGSFGAGVAGAVIGWSTATLNRNRLIRGRTFIVPIAKDAFEGDGTLLPDALTTWNNAATALIASNTGFAVWSRPRLGVGGLAAPVVSHRINDKAAFLSSRRT